MNKSFFLIAYDISSDKMRTKLAKRLIREGLDRLQNSVFWGPLKQMQRIQLLNWIEQILNDSEKDSILVSRLNKGQLRQSRAFGKPLNVLSDWLIEEEVIFI